jgi:NADH-quinone oxidoreductase subunit G
MAENADKLISVFIDGIESKVLPGTNMIEAARKVGIQIPHYCYHRHLSLAGNCRMCLVEMGTPAFDRVTKAPVMGPDGRQVIQWVPKPTIACATNATPGLCIRTKTKIVQDCREGIMEFLLVNHPLDCPICDQAGECSLQEYSHNYGRGASRYVEDKNAKPKHKQLGPRVILDNERCILCGRCIRFCKEVAKDEVLGFTERGSRSTIDCFPGRTLDNNYSVNVVDICPVGALTSTDFRFKMRVWFLKETPSVSTESSVGVNTTIWSREGVIHRITPRRNDAVNDSWMSDSGRDLYKAEAADNRVPAYAIDGKAVKLDEALKTLVETIRSAKGLAIVGGGAASVEEQWLLAKIAAIAPSATKVKYLVPHTGAGDGLLISADRNPNTRGALLAGLVEGLDKCDISGLKGAVDSGAVDSVISINEDILAAGLALDELKKVRFVSMDTHFCDASQYAKIEIPLLTVFEKAGTFVNQQFRLQKFAAAVPGPVGVLSDVEFFAALLTALGGKAPKSATPTGVWAAMSAEVPQFKDVSFDKIPSDGLLLDGSAFAGQKFPEGKSLHYAPVGA